LLFDGNISYANAPQCNVVHTLPLLLIYCEVQCPWFGTYVQTRRYVTWSRRSYSPYKWTKRG